SGPGSARAAVVPRPPTRGAPRCRADRTTRTAAVPARRGDRLLEVRGGRAVDVDERHPRALGAEVLHDGRADAARAAGHEDDAIAQARVRGVRHGSLLGMRVRSEVTAHTLARGRLARTARPPVSSPRMGSITLRQGALGVTLAPAIGGSIARFWSDARGTVLELLRPASADAVSRGDPGTLSSFPLVPWSNRIRAGRFTFDGRPVAL